MATVFISYRRKPSAILAQLIVRKAPGRIADVQDGGIGARIEQRIKLGKDQSQGSGVKLTAHHRGQAE